MDMALMLCEGRSYSEQLRGGQLALALSYAHEVQIGSEKSDAYSPWRAMLTGAEQLRLRDLDTPPSMASRMAQQVWYRTGRSIPLRPPSDCWLVVGGEAWTVTSQAARYYDRALVFSPFGEASNVGETLSPAVFTDIFTPTPRALEDAHLVVIATGDERHDAAMAQWLKDAGVKRVTVFDPYAWTGDPQSGRVATCNARARATLFSSATAVVSAQPRVLYDDHLVWEAHASGAHALALHAPDGASVWDAATVREAWGRIARGDAALRKVDIVDWSAIVPRFALGTVSQVHLEPAARDVAPHRIRHFVAGTLTPKFTPALRALPRVGIILPGPSAVCDVAAQTVLSEYDLLYIDTTLNAQFIVPMYKGIFTQQMKAGGKFPTIETLQNAGDAVACFMREAASAKPTNVDVVHIDDAPSRLRQMREAFEGVGGAGSVAPNVLVHSHKIYNTAAPPVQFIGASVASHGIAAGLTAVAAGRCSLTWLTEKPPTSPRGRIAFYPFSERVGIDQDEVDYATLPALLKQDAVDVILHPDPVTLGSLAARATWARKAVPVVGMLHSIHAAKTATEAVFQLLDSPTFAYDVIISPSRCGAEAYAKLLAAASEWLAPRVAKAPAFNGRIVTIPYGIDGAFYQGLDRAACRKAMDLPRDATVLLSLCRLSRSEKADLLPLLLAVRALKRRGRPVFLVLGGGSAPEDYGDSLETTAQALEISEHVRVIEDVVMYDKVLLYGAADVFVTISDNLQETYGLTILEAMSAGLPVVAGAWDGYRELVRHDDTGLLVDTTWWPPNEDLQRLQRVAEGLHGYGFRDAHELVSVNTDALVAALDALCQNRDLRDRMGARGQAVCNDEYDAFKQAVRVVDLCRESAAQAAATTWAPTVSAVTPYFDPAAARFGHYPTHTLTPRSVVTCHPDAADDAYVNTVVTQAAWGSESESRWAKRIVITARDKGALQVDALVDATMLAAQAKQIAAGMAAKVVTDDERENVRRRIARCLKVGLLRVDDART